MWRRGPVFLQFFHSTWPCVSFPFNKLRTPFLIPLCLNKTLCTSWLEFYDLSLIRHCRMLIVLSRMHSPTLTDEGYSPPCSTFHVYLATITREKSFFTLHLHAACFLLFFDQKHYFSNACFYDVASLCKVYDILY